MKPLANLAAALLLAAAAATAGATGMAVPFIADDYPQALALARSKKLPLFVEAWAPW